MRTPTLLLMLAVSGTAMAADPATPDGAAPPTGNTTVSFKKPDKFTDAGTEGIGSRTSPRVLDALKAHLEQLGAKKLPSGETLQITITDIDLAGRFDPQPGGNDRVRIMRDVDWPRIELHYTLQQDGRTLADADASLSDMNYLMHSSLRRSTDPLRYEKDMLDAWFATTFERKPAKAR